MIRNWLDEDAQNPGEHAAFARNVVRWISKGYTSAQMCFVWADGAEIKGGIAFDSRAFAETGILDFSLSADSFGAGADFLLEAMGRISAASIGYHLYNDSERYEDYKQCFLSAGFTLVQQKLSYWFTRDAVESVMDGLEYRPLTDVGEQAFAKAVEIVTSQTLDSMDARSVVEHGGAKAAEMLINDLKEIDFRPELWELAYLNGELAGLIVPTDFGKGTGAINYIGVAPGHRGKGYVGALLRRGTAALLARGATTIIADIDVQNFPMKAALERLGFEFKFEEAVLEKTM